MRVVYNRAVGVLSEMTRAKLRGIFSEGSDKAMEKLRGLFPLHIVSARLDHIQVTRKDGTVIVDLVNDGSGTVRWIGSKVNLRMTTK